MKSECLQEGTFSAWISLLWKQSHFQVLCGCIVSTVKWQNKPSREVKIKLQDLQLFYSFRETGQPADKTVTYSLLSNDSMKYFKLLVK